MIIDFLIKHGVNEEWIRPTMVVIVFFASLPTSMLLSAFAVGVDSFVTELKGEQPDISYELAFIFCVLSLSTGITLLIVSACGYSNLEMFFGNGC